MFDHQRMKEIETILQDMRSNLPEGPWSQEPDRVEFVHEGFQCLLQRSAGTFGWCGYVGVPLTHPIHSKNVDECGLEVHGGVTYSQECSGHICHITQEQDTLFWVGFDCAHAWDLAPALQMRFPGMPESKYFYENPPEFMGLIYRDQQYVEQETKHLAAQLRTMESESMVEHREREQMKKKTRKKTTAKTAGKKTRAKRGKAMKKKDKATAKKTVAKKKKTGTKKKAMKVKGLVGVRSKKKSSKTTKPVGFTPTETYTDTDHTDQN